MKVAVVGGSGRIGSLLTHALVDHGYEVQIIAPSHGVDARTGQNLDAALRGAHVVVDTISPPATVALERSYDFFDTSTKNLLAASRAAGVGHYVLLSIVGADRLSSEYFRGKLAQETRVRASRIPHTILRSTLYFEALDALLRSAPDSYQTVVPQVEVRPLSGRDLARLLAHHVAAEPGVGTYEVAGPERAPLADLAFRYLRTCGDMRTVVSEPGATTYLGTRFTAGDTSLLPRLEVSRTSLAEWMSQRQVVRS